MLGRATYDMDYITAVHNRVTRVLKAFDKAKPPEPFATDALIDIVLGLEMAFVHRLRGKEGKDGNPLNEVRMIVASVLEHGGTMTRDNSIKYEPGRSVTGLALGSKIALTRKQVGDLVDAFVEELAKKFA